MSPSKRRGDTPKGFDEGSVTAEEQVDLQVAEVRRDAMSDGGGVVMAWFETREGQPMAPVNDVLSCLCAVLILLAAMAGGSIHNIMAQKRLLSRFPAMLKPVTVDFARFHGPFPAISIVGNCGNNWGILPSDKLRRCDYNGRCNDADNCGIMAS